jgi:uncharacterized membrane protein
MENPYEAPHAVATSADSDSKLISDRVLGCLIKVAGFMALVVGSLGVMNLYVGLVFAIPLMMLVFSIYFLSRIGRQSKASAKPSDVPTNSENA